MAAHSPARAPLATSSQRSIFSSSLLPAPRVRISSSSRRRAAMLAWVWVSSTSRAATVTSPSISPNARLT
ncbi:hypothetical protein D3C80_1076830 [compost metagenome]